MKQLQMVDLLGQYEQVKEQMDKAILDVVSSSIYIGGPQVKGFQEELEQYLGVKHVIPCANGTDALQIAMMALGLQPGDEIITAAFTYVATAEVIALLQLKPVLVDVDPDTFNIDTEQVRKAIGPKTKAIVPVHLFGQCANMEEILAIASESNIYVIEDTAQAIGSRYTFSDGKTVSAGCMGHIGCTSFFPSKNLGCYGDGGAMMTNDDDLAFKIRQIANHGQGQRYYHDVVGVNSRLDAMQAAILRVKLPHLDKYNEKREKAAAFYDSAFSGTEKLITPVREPKSTHVFHQYTLKTNGVDRNVIPEKLSAKGIPSMIYYPVPLHLQKAYSNLGYSEGQFPVTEDLCRRVFSLPMHTELTNEQLEFIVKGVLEAIS